MGIGAFITPPHHPWGSNRVNTSDLICIACNVLSLWPIALYTITSADLFFQKKPTELLLREGHCQTKILIILNMKASLETSQIPPVFFHQSLFPLQSFWKRKIQFVSKILFENLLRHRKTICNACKTVAHLVKWLISSC